MATSKQSNRLLDSDRRGGASGAVGMGVSGRSSVGSKDANRFLVGLIIMAVVFALMLPITALMYMDILSVRATIRAEAKELRKLKEELRPKPKPKEDENE